MKEELYQWLLESDEPWTRYRTRLDLLGQDDQEPEVETARAAMLAHPLVKGLAEAASTWGQRPMKRHNDASYPSYALSTLVDFGLQADDPGIGDLAAMMMAHQSPEGPYQTVVNIPRAFGGTGEDAWTWIICDTPTLLYALLGLGLGEDAHVQRAAAHLTGLVNENGFRCVASPDLGRFKGPGKRGDPCPIANVYMLKALSLMPGEREGKAAHLAAEMLLMQWELQKEQKYFLFAMGSDFRKLKYPFVWYDLLHVLDVLSRFPFVHTAPRFHEMLAVLTEQADDEGRYTATSMYRAWKGWSFADKKKPSPWLTYLAMRIQARVYG